MSNMWTHYPAPKQVGRIGLGRHRRRIDVLLKHDAFLRRCQSTMNVKVYDLFDSVVPYEQVRPTGSNDKFLHWICIAD